MDDLKKIEQQEINDVVWSACDTFRGVVDSSSYKNYILTFLFVKYLSDVWKDHRSLYMEQYDGDITRVERRMKREPFQLPQEACFDYIYGQRNADNLGEIINTALELIEDANRGRLDNVFRNIDFNSESELGKTKERNRLLQHLIDDFKDLDLRPSRIQGEDIIGNAYEYLIANFASDAGKKGGEFYTPGEVATLIAKLVKAKPGDRISDPTCGSGSLLIKVSREAHSKDFWLFGQEKNGSTWALCKMNMFLHGIVDNARIEWGDTIADPLLIENDGLMKFNITIANPPFSLDKWGADNAEHDKYDRFKKGIPPKSKGDFAFILHMIETMDEDDGKVAVVVPHGVLFRGSSEGRIRQALIEENLLHAVIGLPANLFFGTGIPAAILVFKKNRDTNDVLFIDASKEFEKGKNQNKLTDENIDKVVKTYDSFETVDKYSYVASIDEIKENDFNLNIPRYVDSFEEEEPIDMEKAKTRMAEIDKELKEVEAKMEEYLKELGM
ncbi:type I restriction-modification system subunit M [Clostridium botulinum]|uniref:site-specific DNA-methyltransferase (adenine-specific) n=1 Tax=Clostridium botulinum TaxID=1491 RepID=A0A6M0V4A5_CLOBO|nr:type I restriction-modification system subunit M [Clostridium botulinum]MCS6112583.1 type I restriction-modification system subunit M [Clostridium botulinum]NFE13092.1 type I restriction-modification system subunit M [Clostridium botulinum]NFE61234.1 type I restriction-modification system subunit M [Clostridium botulinum]NFF87297.1 type I restriction-modification system subunit M [Clostridium botulinum]NFG11342.1 type I restriction-modification system subunit M [Clostridium botulinum]